jgi:hypothetical protein
VIAEHAAHNAMDDPSEIERFYDGCSDYMRQLLDALAALADRPRTFPEIEGGRRPYHFHDARWSESGRWELWMDCEQARAVRDGAGGRYPGRLT